jgi:hypothetical protein
MTIRTILITISFGLLVWLLIDNIFQLDIGATKNNGLTAMEKQKVDEMQSIDSVKTYAKSSLDKMRKNVTNKSSLATKRIWLVLTVIFIQLFLLTRKRQID